MHTSDGALRVRISRVPGDRRATLHTADGDLTGPDHLVDITVVGERAGQTGTMPTSPALVRTGTA